VEVVQQDERPDRKVHHITDLGRTELRRWLAAPLAHKSPRAASLIQVFFAAQLPDELILEMLRAWKAGIEAAVAQFAEIPSSIDEYRAMVDSPREQFFWMLTLECGIANARAELAWIQSAIARIESKTYTNQFE
jgi:DNA-binding PadR family transcriptional regulator